jgi:hypothetical protein
VPKDRILSSGPTFLVPKVPGSSSGLSERDSSPSIDPALESEIPPPALSHKPAPANFNFTPAGPSRKMAASVSLQSDVKMKAILKRLAELEIGHQEHANALALVAALYDDVQELKNNENELRTIITKLSAGQILSPAESKKVTDESNNTVKV